jgi:hypothetical protein
VVVDEILGVVKVAPLPRSVPPVDASYQSIVVPAELVADIVTVPGPHLEPLTGDVAAAGIGLIVAVTAVLVVDTQPVVVFLVCA